MNNREIFDSTIVYLKINSRVNRHLYLWVLTKQLSKQVTSTTKRQLLKMCHLRHRLRIFFIMQKSYAWFSRHSSFCIFNHDLPNL